MTPISESDLVNEINNIYFKSKKNNPNKVKTGEIFKNAVQMIFDKYSHIFGFESVSDLKKVYSEHKKAKKMAGTSKEVPKNVPKVTQLKISFG